MVEECDGGRKQDRRGWQGRDGKQENTRRQTDLLAGGGESSRRWGANWSFDAELAGLSVGQYRRQVIAKKRPLT
jgi:hypothetical protein